MGVEKDMEKSSEWYIQAANEGDTTAMNNLGIQYKSKKEYVKAFELFEKAAEKGYVSSIYQIGLFYQKGLHGNTDLEKAIEFYKKAAALGNEKAIEALKQIEDTNNQNEIQET